MAPDVSDAELADIVAQAHGSSPPSTTSRRTRRGPSGSRGSCSGGVAAAALLALVVFASVLAVVGSTIRLALQRRRTEVEVLKLVGATDGFVKGPFLIEGSTQGALGAHGRDRAPRRAVLRRARAPRRRARGARRHRAVVPCPGTSCSAWSASGVVLGALAALARPPQARDGMSARAQRTSSRSGSRCRPRGIATTAAPRSPAARARRRRAGRAARRRPAPAAPAPATSPALALAALDRRIADLDAEEIDAKRELRSSARRSPRRTRGRSRAGVRSTGSRARGCSPSAAASTSSCRTRCASSARGARSRPISRRRRRSASAAASSRARSSASRAIASRSASQRARWTRRASPWRTSRAGRPPSIARSRRRADRASTSPCTAATARRRRPAAWRLRRVARPPALPLAGRVRGAPARREGTDGPGPRDPRAARRAGARGVRRSRRVRRSLRRLRPLVILDHGDHYYTVSGNLAASTSGWATRSRRASASGPSATRARARCSTSRSATGPRRCRRAVARNLKGRPRGCRVAEGARCRAPRTIRRIPTSLRLPFAVALVALRVALRGIGLRLPSAGSRATTRSTSRRPR